MCESRLTIEDELSSIIYQENPRRSLTLKFSSLMIIDGIFSRKRFSYNRLPSQLLRLSVIKLNGSCFHVEVAKTATIAELKQAVEAVFSHMPQKGPGKISWTHLWGQFCLCYDGQKLVTETDYLRNHGIKDGDQLRFIHHVSNICSSRKKWLKKRVVNVKHHMSSLQANKYQQKEHHDDDDDIDLEEIVIEKGKIEHCTEEDGVGKKRLSGSWGGLLSYTRLAVVRRVKIGGRICPSMIARGIQGSSRRLTRREY